MQQHWPKLRVINLTKHKCCTSQILQDLTVRQLLRLESATGYNAIMNLMSWLGLIWHDGTEWWILNEVKALVDNELTQLQWTLVSSVITEVLTSSSTDFVMYIMILSGASKTPITLTSTAKHKWLFTRGIFLACTLQNTWINLLLLSMVTHISKMWHPQGCIMQFQYMMIAYLQNTHEIQSP